MIQFSRIQLWTDDGVTEEFYMPGVPRSYDDLEDDPEFVSFAEFISAGNLDIKEITVYYPYLLRYHSVGAPYHNKIVPMSSAFHGSRCKDMFLGRTNTAARVESVIPFPICICFFRR